MKNIYDFYNKKISDNTKVEIIARLRSNRNNKKIAFLTVNDGTILTDLQVVCKISKTINFDEIKNLTIASVLQITGVFKLTPNTQQPFEIIADKINILDLADKDYPLQKKEHSLDYLRTIAHIRSRTNLFQSVFKIRSLAQYAIHSYFTNHNFVNIHTPIITSNDAEGAGESFIVTTRSDNKYSKDFFGKKASLTVSGQLNAEAFAQSFKNIYTFGPTFRAENSNTSRHISEFWMVEPEMAFTDLNTIINVAFELLKFVINFVFKKGSLELTFLNKNHNNKLLSNLNSFIDKPSQIITYSEAIEILILAVKKGKKFNNSNIKWGMDLQTEHERYICEEKYLGPVAITHYPAKVKSFYMKQNDDNKTVACFDLLVPGIGELIGGSQRENSYDKIKLSCSNKKIDTSYLKWYIDLRNYGYYKSSGFGLGFDRLIMYLTGIENIRDVIPYPRNSKSLTF